MPNDVASALEALDGELATRTEFHGGFPYNLLYEHQNLSRFLRYSLNNLGDPYVDGSYTIGTKKFEREVVAYFANLYKLRDPWGYVTACGTEGNYYGLWLGTRLFPDAPIVTSRDSHYSVGKAATISKSRVLYVESDSRGEIDYSDLRRVVYSVQGPLVINLNIGTTVTGAVDRVDRVCDFLEKTGRRFHLHCDGALGGLLEPYLNERSCLDFSQYPIGSLSVSGHKFIGAAMPCGVVIARRNTVLQIEQTVEYIGSVDTTIMGSRCGLSVLFIWQAIRQRNFADEARTCRENAKSLCNMLAPLGWEPLLNELSTTVVFGKPDDAFCRRWQLSTTNDRAHVVVMQNHTRPWLARFVEELGARRERRADATIERRRIERIAAGGC